MGGARRASSRLVPLFRSAAAARNHQTSAHHGAFARNCQISTTGSHAGSSQSPNQRQKEPLRTLFSRTPASNALRRNMHTSTPVLMRKGLVPFGHRYFSADAQPDAEALQRKGLQESQIGEELLTEATKQASGVGLKLADGETLSPEEEAILKEAEAEFESARQSKEEPVSVESIQQMLKDLQAVADPTDPRIAIISLRLGQEYESRHEDPNTFRKLGEQALEIFKTGGEFSLEIAMCHHLIALAHHRLGNQEQSVESLGKAVGVLEGKEENRESAPVRFAVQFLLGDALSGMGKHEEALQCYVEGLRVQEGILEEGHPQLASNYRQVAEAFTQVMLFDEAQALVERALEAHIKIYGKHSLDEAIDRRLLSVIYSGLEEHEKALEEQQTVRLILNEKNLGSEALFVEIAIADTLVTLGRFDDAIATLQNATSELEEGSSLKALSTVNLAKAYSQQGDAEKAEEQFRAAIALLDSKLLGSTGENTELLTAGECYTELAAIHQQMNQPDKAIALLKKGLALYKQLPQQLNATAGSQAQIGMLLLFNGKVDEAISYMEEAATNLRQSFGAGHFSLAVVLNHLAVAHVELKNMTKAVELFEEAKSIYTKTHGPGQQDTLAIFYNLMKVYATTGRKEEAIANAKHIVAELEKQGEPAKSALAEAQKDLANLEEESQSVSSREGTQ